MRLAAEGEPDVLCLQELPLWATHRLAKWSGMRVLADIARRQRLPPPLDRRLTTLNRASSARSSPARRTRSCSATSSPCRSGACSCSTAAGCSARAPASGGSARSCASSVPARERSCSQTCTPAIRRDRRRSRSRTQSSTCSSWRGRTSRSCSPATSTSRRDLHHHGFTGEGPGIDHVLVRGADAGPLVVWPDGRRRLHGMLLSDHAPVERTLT